MRTIGVVLFDQFELLDVFGPLEMFGMLPEEFAIRLVSEQADEIASRQGPASVIEHYASDGHDYDMLLVPGGQGTRREVQNQPLLHWLVKASAHAEVVASVCTGSALLARAGLLDGRRATTNKLAFDWVAGQGANVSWQRRARWVEDGKFWTSSGVSAGTDMALALIARLCGIVQAREVAHWAEYVWNEDSGNDPFAVA
ncbi:DJ-1/PfpI family protein [Dongia sedimenti]|uniref:DJ-1/PfpI family protein n=1 Tax=Dongia sedimenti TaxID=3064282 RepID=A0ABU0YJI2_9PROT|nr:DJ-1/PfpI family protein [Rhodospirillaceae bacterium R-7]